MSSIYFIAVNYNNSKHTIDFLQSIYGLKNNRFSIKIIIVDNNSSKHDKDILNQYINASNVDIIYNSSNIGYFPALNVGLSNVTDKSCVIIGNNDIKFDRDFLEKLCTLEIGSDTLAIAPNIITNDGYNQNPHVINRVSRKRRLGYDIYYSNYYLGKLIYWITQKYKLLKGPRFNREANNAQYIYMGIGACYILTKKFFDYFQKLDDRVFMWGEEALFANQIASVGGKIWYEPSLVVHHYESATISKIPSRHVYDISKKSYKVFSKYL